MRGSYVSRARCGIVSAPRMLTNPSLVPLWLCCAGCSRVRSSLRRCAPPMPAVARRRARQAPARPGRRAPKLDVKCWQLPNGLKVLFLADHKAPIATVQVFYHVGSKDEHVGIRGVAHMFEHMMFKGSEHVPPEEHARLLKEVGGQVNAFTTEDLTAYHDTVPPSYVGFAMKLEAERMRNLKLFPATVDSERQGGRGGEAPAHRQRPDRQGASRGSARWPTPSTPTTGRPSAPSRTWRRSRPQDCQKLLRHLLPAQQRDADRGRRLDEAGGAQAGRPVLRADPARPGAAAQLPAEEPPQTATRDGDAAASRCRSRWWSAATTSRAPPIPTCRALEVLAAILSARRVVAPAPAPGPPGSPGHRGGRRDRDAGGPGALHRLRRLPARPRSGARCRRRWLEEIARVRDRAGRAGRAGQGEEPAGRGVRVRPARPSTASRTRLGEAQYVEGDWRRFIEGASALPGGHRRRRAAGRAQVPGRHQPHARDAGAGRAAGHRPPAPRRAAAGAARAAPAKMSKLTPAVDAVAAPLLRARLRGERAAKPPAAPARSTCSTNRAAAKAGRAGRRPTASGPGAPISSRRRRRPSRRRWRSPRSIASRCRTGCR